jgi:hypothetical protein
MVELSVRLTLKKVLPRVLKAAVWGSLAYILVYYLPLILVPSETLPFDYSTALLNFAIITIFFTVAMMLFSDTIIGYGLGIARALIIIAYFFAVSDSGVLSVTMPIMEVPVKLTVDVSIILLMVISVNLLDIVRNLLKVIVFLTEKSTSVDFT